MSERKKDQNPTNPKIIRACREQMALTIEDAQKKASLKTLRDIEEGRRCPTPKQMDKLAQVYLVPPWVFMERSLPDEYNFVKRVPSFRRFANSHGDLFDYKLRQLTTKVEEFRDIIISLKEEMKGPVPLFSPPIKKLDIHNVVDVSKAILNWLDTKERSFSFSDWRKKLENKGVFVFVTSPFSDWSKIDPETFRGLSIYYPKLPIIVINGSDAYKAKSFTLFHELGHLLRKKTMFDEVVGEPQSAEERLCDNFSGEVLMPTYRIEKHYDKVKKISNGGEQDFNILKNISKEFKTSKYATLVRLRGLNLINQKTYNKMQKIILQNYRSSFNKETGQIIRNRSKEVKNQYGKIYSETIMQAYFNKKITLHKARNLFGLKKVEHILKMMKAVA